MTTIGLLHPGEMGASVGAAARTAGARVLWASEGRGTDTWARAAPRSPWLAPTSSMTGTGSWWARRSWADWSW